MRHLTWLKRDEEGIRRKKNVNVTESDLRNYRRDENMNVRGRIEGNREARLGLRPTPVIC